MRRLLICSLWLEHFCVISTYCNSVGFGTNVGGTVPRWNFIVGISSLFCGNTLEEPVAVQSNVKGVRLCLFLGQRGGQGAWFWIPMRDWVKQTVEVASMWQVEGKINCFLVLPRALAGPSGELLIPSTLALALSKVDLQLPAMPSAAQFFSLWKCGLSDTLGTYSTQEYHVWSSG